MFRVLFPIFPKVLTTGVSGPCEMFQAAESLKHVGGRLLNNWQPLELLRVSPNKTPVKTTGGIQIVPDSTLVEAPPADLVILAPIWGNPMPTVRREVQLRQWLREQYEQGATLIATGTSVCLLAEEGLLDHQPATTHWYFFDRFKALYPQVDLNTQQFITYSNRLYCAGSINALSDLILYLIEQRYGEDITRVVERHFSHEVNRSYEKPFFLQGGNQHHDEDIIRAQEWVNQHWQEEVTLQAWGEAIDMSVRTLSRRFKLATGITPLNYLNELRMGKARELLRDTNIPVTDIAALVGFRDSTYFSRLFRTNNDISPVEYRKMVRSKTFFVQNQDD